MMMLKQRWTMPAAGAALTIAAAMIFMAVRQDGPETARAGPIPGTDRESLEPTVQVEGLPMDDARTPRYSRSGYDITPWTAAEVAAAREKLTPEEDRIAFHAATEAPFCGLYTETEERGIYVSVVSGLPLFRSQSKFHSTSGWASFFEPFDPQHLIERRDSSHGMARVEILDARSGAHLGHVFDDGPPPTGKRYCLNSAALRFIPEGGDLPAHSRPADVQTAYFAGGCFWGVEDRFSRIPGVIDAVSGYMGGHQENPTYRQVSSHSTGHAETVKVLFDPLRVTYETLLKAFFEMHDPTTVDRQGPDVGNQYSSAIFTVTDEQGRRAWAMIESLKGSPRHDGRPIVTHVEPAQTFYEAEDYHQDYHARHGGGCRL
ncbi:MAG: bifunctional methionine sulfoxide reductase B/A protein [Candidatus Eisenbacteria bacterium]